MIIPNDAIIAEEKIWDYLLKPQAADDKAGYLALAGCTLGDYWELLRDIREQLLPADGVWQRSNEFGDFFEALGVLIGPNGRRIGVRSIWVVDSKNQIRFVTLFPD